MTKDPLAEPGKPQTRNAGAVGSFEWLLNQGLVIWSPEHEALFELPQGTFEGALRHWKSRVAADDWAELIAGIEACFSRQQPEWSYDFRAVLPDGTHRWLRTHAQLFSDSTGRPDRVSGISMDIDAQKKAEIHLYQQWRTFDTALSHTPDFTYILDLEGRFTYANRALLSLWQIPLHQAVGKNFFDLDYPPELATRLAAQIQQVIRTRQPLRDSTPFAGPTGEVRHYEYIFVPVLERGTVEAVAGSTRDVTERIEADQKERERQEQLRDTARLESLGIMAGGIAHDFNNLLSGILGNTTLALEMIPPSHPARAILADAIKASERAADLTGQMLAYSGKGRFVTEVLDLNTIVRANLTLLRASLSRTVSVRLELCGEPCFVEADRAQMQQVVMNLLINASEAVGEQPGQVVLGTAQIERSGPQFSTRLRTTLPAGPYIILEVRDNGAGMSSATLKKIFDPFFTTKFTGRGLGLAAVLGIVKSHEGDIEVFSEPGQGTSFRILLPASPHGISRAESVDLMPIARDAGQCVLVVDDEEMVRRMACSILQSRDLKVLTASNGLEAVELLRANEDIALIILDLTMPVMTGEQALPLLKNLRPDIPIILSSGFNEAEITPRFAAAGIADFLQKPYSVSTVLSKVAAALPITKSV